MNYLIANLRGSRLIWISFSFFFCLHASANMVYLYQTESVRRVALADDTGKFLRFLTPTSVDAYHPEISSDGNFVAYSAGIIQPGKKVSVAIEVLDLRSGDVEVWTPQGNQYIHAEFSGDGRYLAFSAPKNPTVPNVQEIQLVDLVKERAKGPAKQVKTAANRWKKFYQPDVESIPCDSSCYFPAVSSDGWKIAYHRTQDTSNKSAPKQVVLYDRRKGTKKLVTGQGQHGMVPSLSADNRYIAYAGKNEGQWDIYLYNVKDATTRKLTNTVAREFTPVFAPDNSIYFTNITESGTSLELDIYKIDHKAIFGNKVVSPSSFIATAGVMEYVPSFSGAEDIQLEEKPSLPSPARSSFGAIFHQGKIYMAGGHQGPEHTYPPESFVDEFWRYDAETKAWKQLASLSRPRHGFQIVAHENYIYAFGGFAYSADTLPKWQSLDIVERYDIEKDQWQILSQRLPRRRSSNVAVKLKDKVYLIGGWDSTPKFRGDKDGFFHDVIDVFDLRTERSYVYTASRLPLKRRAFSAVVDGDKIYLLGGISEGASHFDWLANVTSFEPEQNLWQELAPLPFATFAPGAGILDGSLYLIGGMTDNLAYQNTIYRLDIRQNTWANTGLYLKENKGFPQVVHFDSGDLGILGGHTYQYIEDGKVIDTPVTTFETIRLK